MERGGKLGSLLGRLCRCFVRFLVRFHYPLIMVEGRENLSPDRPCLFLANHANSLIDPVMIGIATRRDVRYLAKAPLFNVPILGWLISIVGMIPTFRAQDDRSQIRRNLESLDIAADILASGKDVGIFPEGKSHDLPTLEPVKGGAARIAILAMEKGAKAIDIVPVGLNFEDKERFRSSVWVRFGEPISLAEWLREQEGRIPKAARELTKEIGLRLRDLVIHLEDAAWAPYIEGLEVLVPPSKRRLRCDPVARLRQRNRLAKAINYFMERSPERSRLLGELIKAQRDRLSSKGLSFRSPVVNHRSLNLLGIMLWRTVRLIVGVFPMAIGTVHHLLPYTLLRLLSARCRRSQPDRTTVATRRLLMGVPIYGLWYAVVWFGLATYFVTWVANLWIGVAPFAGVFALNYWAWFRRTAEWWMGDVFLLFQRSSVILFRQKQKEIRQLLTRFEADFSEVHAPLADPPPFDWSRFAWRCAVRGVVLGGVFALFFWLLDYSRHVEKEPVLIQGQSLASFDPESLRLALIRDSRRLDAMLTHLSELRLEVDLIQRDFLVGRKDFYKQSDNEAVRRLMFDYLSYRDVLLRLIWKYQNFAELESPELHDAAGLISLTAATSLFETSLSFVLQFQNSDFAVRKLNEAEPLWDIPEGVFDRIRGNLNDTLVRERLFDEMKDFKEKPLPFPRSWLANSLGYRKRISHSADLIELGLRELTSPGVVDEAVSTGRAALYDFQSFSSLFVSRLKIREPRADGSSLIDQEGLEALEPLLKPGDILIQRRNWALSNAFMPGYWSHVAVYLGRPQDLAAVPWQNVDAVREALQRFDNGDEKGHAFRIIEALGEGVVFSSLEKSVGEADGVTVLRPQLTEGEKALCLERLLSHLGKPYDFNFDFFSTDKLVCTELLYRAFGDHLPFELVDVLGRKTLPAIEVIRQHFEADGLDGKLGFVAFLDGDERKGLAVFKDEEALRQSLSRSSYEF